MPRFLGPIVEGDDFPEPAALRGKFATRRRLVMDCRPLTGNHKIGFLRALRDSVVNHLSVKAIYLHFLIIKNLENISAIDLISFSFTYSCKGKVIIRSEMLFAVGL